MLSLVKREKHSYFKLLLEIAPIPLVLLDKKWRIVELNRAARFEFDMTEKQACGKDIIELFSKIERDRLREFFSTALKLSQRSPYEVFQAIPKRDMARFMELTATHFVHKGKEGLLVTLRNITNTVSLLSRTEEARNKSEEYSQMLAEREVELEKSRAQLEAILEGGADAIAVRDSHWNLIYANPTALELYGAESLEEFRKLSAEKILKRFKVTNKAGKPIGKEDLPGMRAIREEKKICVHLCFSRNGEEKWYLVHSNPIFDREQNIWMVVNIFHDVTFEIHQEKSREIFLGMVSHELKTPIAVIKAFAQLLTFRLKRKSDKRTKEYLEKIDQQVNRMTKLINNLSDVTRISSGKMEFIKKNFDLDLLIDKTLKELRPTTKQHEILRRGKVERVLYGDQERIGQVISNLILNAIKYSPEGGKIYVKAKRQDGKAIIEVQDFGIGISPKHQKDIFSTYARIASPRTRSIEGQGLGLYIAEAIVKGHAGEIWVESKEGKGSNFFFSLPIR
jgi:PAS domain S-box-containing protein